jgi:ABC-type multidrug transport system fused ATPase/permease subunit
LAEQTPEGKQQAYHWTWVVFAANLSFAQMDVFQRWHTRRCYERTRGQLFCALHYKALQRRDLSGKATQKGSEEEDSADLGRVVNLMQGDCYAVAQRFWDFSAVFASPVRLAIALYFLWQVLGWSCLIGIAVVLVTYTLNLPLAKYNIHVTRQSWKAKDSRSSAVTDLFSNIRFLKYFGWESRWSSKARHARETELKWRVRNNIVDTVTTFLWSRIPAVTTLLCFWSYTYLEGERLTVAKAFTAMALFGSLQGPLTQLPGEIFALLHAYVSMQRIQKFLAEDEVPNWATSLQKHDPAEHAGVTGFTHATFAWDTTSAARFTLGPLNLAFPHGKLSLVCGATSSGKTALLNSLLGETHCMSGSVCLDKLNHSVAYCAQHPWLEQKSIKDNIIFGSSRGFDHGRYNAVIEACALAKDLALLDAGDMTEIGEKGITLSGGQRARLAMARALYSDATTVLLDDPLAAVDMHTAAHLLEHALGGELAYGRTIVLVTHHVRLCLPVASYVVELGDGQVLRAGTPVDLDHLGLLKEIVESEDQPINDDEHTMPPEDDDVPHVDHSRAPTDGKLVDEEAKAEGRGMLSSDGLFQHAHHRLQSRYVPTGRTPKRVASALGLELYFS